MAQFSRRLFKQMLFQQSTFRPHLQVQEAICYAPETCVMCQLWRAARGKGRPYLQCKLQTFLLIYHKWDFQWLAYTFPIHQIISKWHYLLLSFPLQPGLWKGLPASCKVADTMSTAWWMLGLWQLAMSAVGQTWHHLLLFWLNHWELKNQWKRSGHRHLASRQVWVWNMSTQPK